MQYNPHYRDARSRLGDSLGLSAPAVRERKSKPDREAPKRAEPPPEAASPVDVEQLLEATGWKFRRQGDGFVLPFRKESGKKIRVRVVLLNDGDMTCFVTELPEAPSSRRRRKAAYRQTLRSCYEADYVKPIRLNDGTLLLTAELPTPTLDGGVVEGVIRALVELGDVETDGLADEAGWDKRVRLSKLALANKIKVDRSTVRQAILDDGTEGMTVEPMGTRDLRVDFRFAGLPTEFHAVVRPLRQVVSCIAPLGGARPDTVDQLEQLLTLNRAADVAKIAIDSDGDATLLYEVPRVFPGLLTDVQHQFELLTVGVISLLSPK